MILADAIRLSIAVTKKKESVLITGTDEHGIKIENAAKNIREDANLSAKQRVTYLYAEDSSSNTHFVNSDLSINKLNLQFSTNVNAEYSNTSHLFTHKNSSFNVREVVTDNNADVSVSDDFANNNQLKHIDISTTTQRYCDKVNSEFKQLANSCLTGPFHYVRTTNEQHKENVYNIWNRLLHLGVICKGFYKGWYCINDESFIMNSVLQTLSLKKLGEHEMQDSEGKRYLYLEEENYKLDISKSKKKIKNWIEDELILLPAAFKRQALDYLDGSIDKISISRPKSKNFTWGIPVPNDDNHLIYVWFDALIGYLYNNESVPEMQVLGKDIMKFHLILFPAILFLLDIPPPKKLVVHSHLLCNGMKMSKSIGNVYSPTGILQSNCPEILRYYLLKECRLDSDCNFDENAIYRLYTHDFVNGIGNVLSRIFNDKILSKNMQFPIKIDDYLQKTLATCLGNYEEMQFYRIIEESLGIISKVNSLIDLSKPWKLKGCSNDAAITDFYQSACSYIFIYALIMYPVIPDISAKIFDLLSVDKKYRSFTTCETVSFQPISLKAKLFDLQLSL